MTEGDRRKSERSTFPLGVPSGKASLRWLALSVFIIVADQISKMMVVEYLTLYQRINLLPIFDLVRLHNTGAAFSILADAGGWQNTMFTVLAFVVSAGIILWQWQLPAKNHRVLATGLALVLGGAIGNVIDRVMHGYVVDFILFYYQSWSWPAFNVADTAISCGVILIAIDGLFLERKRGGRRESDQSSG
jgi:signal peptidase II